MRPHLDVNRHDRVFSCLDSFAIVRRGRVILWLALTAALISVSGVCYGQAGNPASVTAIAGTPASAPLGTTLAGHIFHQRGDGTANVAVNYYNNNLNTYQDAPNLRVHGKSFSVAFWYRTTQNAPDGLLWDSGDGPGVGYDIGLNNGYISVIEVNSAAGCSFPDWKSASVQTIDGNWHHAAVVADHDAQTTKIYIDGMDRSPTPPIGYCDPADNTSYADNHWYGIGRNCGAGCGPFDFAGDIDHFTAWVGAALTPAEVTAHMDGGMPEFAKVGVWYEFENIGQCPVGNNNAQCVPDLGPNHYDGHVSPDTTSTPLTLPGPGPAFQALVLDASNNPVPDVAVTFTDPASGASGSFTGEVNHQVIVTTEATGTATAPTFTANSTAGTYKVNAKVLGVTNPAKFSLTNLGPPASITVVSGTPQSAAIGTAFATALQAKVKDSANDPVPNAAVTFTVTASGSGASGTFTGGLTTVIVNTNASGIAAAPFTANMVTGSYTVTATVGGVATGVNFALTNTASTTTTLISSLNPSTYNQTVTLTAKVTSSATNIPSGTVTFKDGSTVLGSKTLSSGAATLSISSLGAGSHSLTATFNGGEGLLASTSTALTQSVAQATSAITLTSSANPAYSWSQVTFTAKVTAQYGGVATGNVTFMDGGFTLGIIALSSNRATFGISTLAVGSHSITAVYAGNTNVQGSSSNSITEVVIPFVQANAATPQSPQSLVTVSYAAPQTLGDLNILVVGWNDTTSSVTSVTDSQNNSYSLAIGPTVCTTCAPQSSIAPSQSIYYAPSIKAGNNTVMVTFNQPAAWVDLRILEYNGVSTLDVTSGNSGNSSTSNSGSATTTAANELIFGANTVQTITSGAGSGFVSRIITNPDGDIAEDKTVSAIGSYSATAPLLSGYWVMQMATFK